MVEQISVIFLTRWLQLNDSAYVYVVRSLLWFSSPCCNKSKCLLQRKEMDSTGEQLKTKSFQSRRVILGSKFHTGSAMNSTKYIWQGKKHKFGSELQNMNTLLLLLAF